MKKLILSISIAAILVAGCKKETIQPACPAVTKIEEIKNQNGGIIDHKITLSNGTVINKPLTRLSVGSSYCGI